MDAPKIFINTRTLPPPLSLSLSLSLHIYISYLLSLAKFSSKPEARDTQWESNSLTVAC